MNCSDVIELAPLHFSGELDAHHAGAFAAHLECCPACSLRIRQQAELDVRLREAVLAETLDADAAALESSGSRADRRRNFPPPRATASLTIGIRAGFWPQPPRYCFS